MLQRLRLSWGQLSRLPWQRKRLLVPALCLLCWATICVRRLSFRRIAPWLGQQGWVACRPQADEHLTIARDWAWALNAVAKRLPWTATCLMRALAGQYWLRRQHIPATVVIGIAPGETASAKTFGAHAWLCCGDLVLTGGQEAARFKPIASFGTQVD
jgi:hypothetical protein